MKLAIVGSTRFVNPQGEMLARNAIEGFMAGLVDTDIVISGGALGVDSWAAEAARVWGFEVVEHFPKNPRWEPDGYKDRNFLIATECDALVRIYCAKSMTYGSGWTADYALKLDKPVVSIKVPEKGMNVKIKTETK